MCQVVHFRYWWLIRFLRWSAGAELAKFHDMKFLWGQVVECSNGCGGRSPTRPISRWDSSRAEGRVLSACAMHLFSHARWSREPCREPSPRQTLRPTSVREPELSPAGRGSLGSIIMMHFIESCLKKTKFLWSSVTSSHLSDVLVLFFCTSTSLSDGVW